LIVGVYESEHDQVELTNVGKVIDERTDGKLSENLVMYVLLETWADLLGLGGGELEEVKPPPP
jgi:hypothetical protein